MSAYVLHVFYISIKSIMALMQQLVHLRHIKITITCSVCTKWVMYKYSYYITYHYFNYGKQYCFVFFTLFQKLTIAHSKPILLPPLGTCPVGQSGLPHMLESSLTCWSTTTCHIYLSANRLTEKPQ